MKNDLKKIIEKTQVFLFDLDGTLYISGDIIGNAAETLDKIRGAGKGVAFLTNNSSLPDDDYVKKLTEMGLMKEGDVFYSSLDGAADYIKENYPQKTVYPLATERAKNYLKEQGIKVRGEEDGADIALLCFDKETTYNKLTAFDRLLREGKIYLSTHPDGVCPFKPYPIPDAGAFIAFFKVSAERIPDVIIGKPQNIMKKYLSEKLGASEGGITMVGDRLNTDIDFGKNCGFNTLLVLSGETTEDMSKKSEIKADAVIGDVDVIAKYL